MHATYRKHIKMMLFPGILLLGLGLIILGLSACDTPDGAENRLRPATTRSGVISMAPHLTETIHALGQGERLIAVGSFDDYPPEIASLPRVGGYMDPELERISLLSPELIVLPGRHEKVTSYARLYNIPVLNVHMDSFETIFAGIRTLGEALDCETEAEALIASMKAEMAALEARVADLPRYPTLIITARQPGALGSLYTTGGNSFISEMLALIGADNIHKDVEQAYFSASKETVVMRAPEIIVEFRAGEDLNDAVIDRLRSDWRQMGTLPAVQNDRIYFVTESHAMRPGPRIFEVADSIARMIHGDAYPGNDANNAVATHAHPVADGAQP